MTARSIAKAIAKGEKPDTVTYLAERAKLFGRVKADRKRHREKAALNQPIWEPPLSVDTNDCVRPK